MNRHLFKRLFPALAFVAAFGFAVESLGCNVPVFRYALERWERDEYQLIVAEKGELPPECQKWVEELNRESYREEGFCNLNVHVLDITDESNRNVLEVYPDMALARAIFAGASILFADEPTGNLDRENAAVVLNYMKKFADDGGVVVMVTHDDRALEYASRKVSLIEGQIES